MKYLGWVLMILSSCNNCRNDGCPTNATFKFKIIDQEENNLLIVSNQEYSFESLKITWILNGETIQLNSINQTDFVEVPLTINQTNIVISYGSVEIDTLELLNQKYNQDDCCGSFLEDFSAELKENLLCQSCSTTMAVIEKVR